MRVVVVGLGYVGSVCAACLSGRGHTVVGVDSSAFKADCIGRGESPIVETGLDALIAEAMSGRGTWLVLSRAEDLDPEGHFASLMASRHPDAERFEFEGVKVWHVRGAETAPPGSGPR